MIAKPSGKEHAERPSPVREAALYDPDSVFRDHPAIAAPAPAEPRSTAPTGDGAAMQENSPLYARGEKRRASGGMTKETIKRIADRAEQAGQKPK